MRTSLLLASLLLLGGCFVDNDWEEFTLDRAPFANAWVDRGAAEFEVLLADGYTCPDGLPARVYLIEPATPADPLAPRNLALLLHGRNFDIEGTVGQQGEVEDVLSATWGALQVERTLGMESSLGPTAQGQGAWVAELLARDFAVVAPANCWGDLWHGQGRNDYDEGFLRLGTWLADEAIAMADAREGISAAPLLVVALGEGGRGVVELHAAGTPIDGAFIDGSYDWLSPMTALPATYRPQLDGLLAIYDDEVGDIEDPAQQLDALRVALERDSMVAAVRDRGFRAPLVWAWSSVDERINPAFSQPASDTISTTYPAGQAEVLDWAIPEHAPSNRNPTEAGARLEWLMTRMGLTVP